MHGAALGALIYAAAHITGFISTVAPVFGQVGTVIATIDRGVADAVNINTYVKQKRTGRAAKKVVKP